MLAQKQLFVSDFKVQTSSKYRKLTLPCLCTVPCFLRIHRKEWRDLLLLLLSNKKSFYHTAFRILVLLQTCTIIYSKCAVKQKHLFLFSLFQFSAKRQRFWTEHLKWCLVKQTAVAIYRWTMSQTKIVFKRKMALTVKKIITNQRSRTNFWRSIRFVTKLKCPLGCGKNHKNLQILLTFFCRPTMGGYCHHRHVSEIRTLLSGYQTQGIVSHNLYWDRLNVLCTWKLNKQNLGFQTISAFRCLDFKHLV